MSRFSKFIFSVLFLNNYTRDTPFNYLSSEARHFFGGDGKPTFGLVTILTTWSHLVVIPVNSLSHLATAGHTWQQLLTFGTIWSHIAPAGHTLFISLYSFFMIGMKRRKRKERTSPQVKMVEYGEPNDCSVLRTNFRSMTTPIACCSSTHSWKRCRTNRIRMDELLEILFFSSLPLFLLLVLLVQEHRTQICPQHSCKIQNKARYTYAVLFCAACGTQHEEKI